MLVRNYDKEFEEVYTKAEVDSKLKEIEVTDGSITNEKIANGTITGAKLADETIYGAKITPNSLTDHVIRDNAITGAKIRDGAIENAKIANRAVTSEKIAENAIYVVGTYSGSGAIDLGFQPSFVQVTCDDISLMGNIHEEGYNVIYLDATNHEMTCEAGMDATITPTGFTVASILARNSIYRYIAFR